MRAFVAVCVLAACGGYRTRAPAHVSRAGCSVDGTVVDAGVDGLDNAPIAIAYVHHSFMPSDVLAVWADGAVVMTGEHGERMQGTVSVAEATRAAHEIAAALARAPDYAELQGPTDQPRVELFAREGTHWRHALVWGASPTSYGDAPPAFQAAYRALLALHPASPSRFSPADLAIDYKPVDLGTAPIAWPADVPQPPADQTSAVFDPRYDAQLRTVVHAMHAAPPHAVEFANRTWRVDVHRRFRGELAVERVVECAHHAR
jgi:hypothetical protein